MFDAFFLMQQTIGIYLSKIQEKLIKIILR